MDDKTWYDTSEETKGWHRGDSPLFSLGSVVARSVMGLPVIPRGIPPANSAKKQVKKRRGHVASEDEDSEGPIESEDDDQKNDNSFDDSSLSFDGDYPEASVPHSDDDGQWMIVTEGISLPEAMAGLTLAAALTDSIKERTGDYGLETESEDNAEPNSDGGPEGNAHTDDDRGSGGASFDSDDDDGY